ncbi:MAG: hypothetical protein U5K54_19375 [Cytophagales bacterium]|nr:hypothetical protein [Cytophagales bacterium]
MIVHTMLKARTQSVVYLLNKMTLVFLSCLGLQLHAQVTFQGTPTISLPSTPQELTKGDFIMMDELTL